MKALLLAGGTGRKMWPYSELRQKCALPVLNTPAVRLLAEDLLALGLEGLAVGLGEHPGSVRNALRGLPDARLRFVDVPRTAGTAAAAWTALSAMSGDPAAEDWLVVYGDMVTARENLAALIERFERERPDVAVLTAELGFEDGRDVIGVKVRDGRLVEVEGHSRDDVRRLCGAFVFSGRTVSALRDNPGIFRHVPVGGMPPSESDIGESLQMLLEEGAEIAGVECVEFFVDLDRPWHLLEANRHALAYRVARTDRDIIPASCRISDGAEIGGRLILGENTVIGNRTVISGTLFAGDHTGITNGPILQGDIFLGRDVKVRDYALLEGGTVCGDRGIYGHGSEFSGVAFDNVYLYHYCEMSGILGSSVDIGAATVCGTLRFDDRETSHIVNGRRETPKHGSNASYIGDYSRTGVNAIIMPGKRIGNHSCVGAGVVVYEDVPSRQIVTVRQELQRGPWGPERYGW
ncbi:MAG: NDP-sugar synthase [Capsulimonadales bacterium]|nr:NDP-sugar synthase [Capsulimonadales bacterium]